MKQKILILGGAGFIGLNLAKRLVKDKDNEVTLVDSYFGRKMSDYFPPQTLQVCNILELDLTEPSSYDRLTGPYDHVYLLASMVGVNNTLNNPHEVIRINCRLIMNCLDWLSATQVGRVLFTSTSEAYAGTTESFDYPIPTAETVPLCIADVADPRFTYAITKILGESAFLNYHNRFSFESVIVRYHNVYGPDMGFKHVIPHVIERFLGGENPFQMYGKDQTRAFCFIDDAVNGTKLAMESKAAAGEVFHIGTSDETSIGTLIEMIGVRLGFCGEYEPAETYPGSVTRRCPNIDKARAILGYEPSFDLDAGLDQTIHWYVEFFKTHGKPSRDGFIPRENFG